jgi:hypothetical protein
MKIYIVNKEDPWDEYYERKFFKVFDSEAKAAACIAEEMEKYHRKEKGYEIHCEYEIQEEEVE